MNQGTYGVPQARPQKDRKTAKCWRGVTTGGEVWVGENGYCYPLTHEQGAIGVGGGQTNTYAPIPFYTGDFAVVSANGTTYTQSFCNHAGSGSIPGYSIADTPLSISDSSNCTIGTFDKLTPSRSIHARNSDLGNLKALTSAGGASNIAHGADVGVYGDLRTLPNGNIVLAYGQASTSYPYFRVITPAGAQVVAATALDGANQAQNSGNLLMVRVLPLLDNGLFFVWARASNALYYAIHNADGSQRVAPTQLTGGGYSISNAFRQMATLTPAGKIVLMQLRNGSSPVRWKLHQINPSTGAVEKTNEEIDTLGADLGCIGIVGNMLVVAAAADAPASNVVVSIVDPSLFTVVQTVSLFAAGDYNNDSTSGKYTVASVTQLPSSELLVHSTPQTAGQRHVFRKINLNHLRRGYKALHPASADQLIQLMEV